METLEEVMEEVQATMQHIADDAAAKAERDNMNRLQAFLIGDFYERVAAEKVENLKTLHNA